MKNRERNYASLVDRRIVLVGLLVVFVALMYSSCRHSPVIPDTPQVSFSAKIKPIIDVNCARSGCHGGTDPEEFLLTDYNAVMQIVVQGDAHNSILYQVITELSGESRMPPDHPLSEQQIVLIYTWIMQGAKNN